MTHMRIWSGGRVAVAALLVASAGVVGIIPWRAVAQQPAPEVPATQPVSDSGGEKRGADVRDGAGDIEVIGTLVAPTLTISARMDGAVEQVSIKEADRVTKGQELMKFESAGLELALNEQERLCQKSEAEWVRMDQLRKKNLVSEEDHQQAAMARELARLALKRKERDLSDATVPAPAAGVIGEIRVRPGEFVSRGTALAKLVEVGELKMEMRVQERYAPLLKSGQKIELAVEAYPDRHFTGQLDAIAPQIDPGTRTILVKARVSNPSGELWPGMSARAKVYLRE